jgi:hypothetical protein
MEGYSRSSIAELDDIWRVLGSGVTLNREQCDNMEKCQETPENFLLSATPKEMEYEPDVFLNNLPRDIKYHILKESNGNVPPKFVFHFIAQLLCPGDVDDSSAGSVPASTDWTKVTVFKNSNSDSAEMGKWERRDLVDMLNQAYKNANVLMEDVYCMYNSEDDIQLENMCLFQLKNMKLRFKLKKNDADIDLTGNEIFSWFIKYYQCQIVSIMIEDMTKNENCKYDISDILNFFMKCSTVFGTG